MTVWTAAVAIIGIGLLFSGCKGKSTSPTPLPRSYYMGFSGIPPRADINITIAAIDIWSLRADAAIMSYELPWDSLLAGVPAESLVSRYLVGLANYFRAKGHQIWVYIDPANGLNRAGEADALINLGRSITEPEIQQIYRRWVIVVDSMVQPEHLGLALETNLIRGLAPASLYAAIKQAVNDAATELISRNTPAKLSVSVQVDYAWGVFTGGVFQGVDTDFVDFPFIEELGLSSYPYLAGFSEPENIPLDYYSRLVQGRNIPVMVTEGGYTSANVGGITSTPDKQRRYIVHQAKLLDNAQAIAVFQLTFTDLDLSSYPPNPNLEYFAYLGLVDVDLNPKPALSAWDAIYARPRQ